jgi:hypothetical protein
MAVLFEKLKTSWQRFKKPLGLTVFLSLIVAGYQNCAPQGFKARLASITSSPTTAPAIAPTMVPGEPPPPATLKNLFRTSNGLDILLTTNHSEYLSLINGGWRDEGVIGRLYEYSIPNSKPLFRLGNVNGIHYYTTDKAEYDSSPNTKEGILGYLPSTAPTENPNNSPVYKIGSGSQGPRLAFNEYDRKRWISNYYNYDPDTLPYNPPSAPIIGYIYNPLPIPQKPRNPFNKGIGDDWAGRQPVTWPDGNNHSNQSAEEILSTQYGTNFGDLGLPWATDFLEKDRPNGICLPNEEPFEGYCFDTNTLFDVQMKAWAKLGGEIRANTGAGPRWAVTSPDDCDLSVSVNGTFTDGSGQVQHDYSFCAPSDDLEVRKRFRRNVRMVVHRYGGLRESLGRITDYRIFNEANHAVWFNVGCNSQNCDHAKWIRTYAHYFMDFYDEIHKQDQQAKVIINTVFYKGTGTTLFIPAKDFLIGVDQIINPRDSSGQLLGELREWNLSIHPYTPNFAVVFDPYEMDTSGIESWPSMAQLVAELKKQFHRDFLVGINEGGINSDGITPQSRNPFSTLAGTLDTRYFLYPASEEIQRELMCKVYRIVSGTPGLGQYAYYRGYDNPGETASNMFFGLFRPSITTNSQGAQVFDFNSDGRLKFLNPKKSWSLWSTMNLQGSLNCGFEDLAANSSIDPKNYSGPYYTRLSRYMNYAPESQSLFRHWTSTRPPPDGRFMLWKHPQNSNLNLPYPNLAYREEGAWALFREPQPGATLMLYECGVGHHTFIRSDINCDGLTTRGPLGYVYPPGSQPPGASPIYSCSVGPDDHFISGNQDCEGQNAEGLLGYAPMKLSVRTNVTNVSTVAVYRLAHPNTGEHLYTTSQIEYNTLNGHPWLGEEVAFRAFNDLGIYQDYPTTPLHRFGNKAGGPHFSTTSAQKIIEYTDSADWTSEGAIAYVLSVQAPGTVPLYRLSRGELHFFTIDANEYQTLTAPAEGWVGEGITGYVLKP